MLLRPRLFGAANVPGLAARVRGASARRLHSSFRPPPTNQTGCLRLLYGTLGVNTAVFVAWKYADNSIPIEIKGEHLDLSKPRAYRFMEDNFTFKSYDLQIGRWWTPITHAFSHSSLPHFVFNMVALKTFGEALISTLPGMRPLSFAALYMGAGVAGFAGFVGWQAYKQQDKSTRRIYGAQGASGAVSGLVAVSALVAPRALWQIMLIPIDIPAWAVASAFFAYDIFGMSNADSRIGHSSHLSGALFGAVYYLLVLRRLRIPFRRVR